MVDPRSAGQVLTVELEAGLLVHDDKGAPNDAQFLFVGMNYVEGGKAVAALVLDQIAMRPVQPPRQGPEGDSALLASASQFSTKSGFGSERGIA
jgi:hypothetical protein